MKIENVIHSSINARPSNVARQMRGLLIASLITLSMALIPGGTVHAVGTVTPINGDAIKWHPGHYYMLMSWGNEDPNYLAKVYSELKDTPALRGVTIRYTWNELEPTRGVYDFGAIEDRLAELAAQKKRLIILLQMKSFDRSDRIVPSYIRTDEYEGGVFPLVDKGYNMRLWNTGVHDRLSALLRALGKRFNSHPYFEGIGFTESAMSKPAINISDYKIDKFYDNMIILNARARRYFPNTMTFQYANYPRPILPKLTRKLSAVGGALGAPDIFLDQPGLFIQGAYTPQGIYNYYPQLSGTIPLILQAERPNYVNTRKDGSGHEPTVSELLSFARNQMKVNYIFWTRTDEHHSDVLQVLNWRNQTSNPEGGLNRACPKTFPSCARW